MPQKPGHPSRDPALDVLPGFQTPPPGYGEVAFYWWQAEPLTKERILWQLDQMAGWKISGLQVNYAHSDQGGLAWGLTYPSDPPLFSESWWELYQWFQKEAARRGISVSLSDYTLGWAGQGWFLDEILAEHPDIHGVTLESRREPLPPDGKPVWDEATLALTVLSDSENPVLRVITVDQPQSLNPMDPRAGAQLIAHFFQRFEDRLPGEAGKGLNYFFSDELSFGVSGNLWDDRFAEEFLARKGYDLVPELPALFADLGPRTAKIRLDYRDVMVALEEENYFQPVYQWHEDRGMIFGCDHGGRGKDVLEFGDYFRTQKWNQAPGNDNPHLESDIIKNKVASSISHLYERPRTWLEGFYGSGWGTSTGDLTDALFRNFVMGHNMISLHGLYYSTQGGWWEWAPPCNHFRMPYARHMKPLLEMSERVSYLLSQGVHRCDVALMYPVAPAEAGLGGAEAIKTAFSLAEALYLQGIDFDFLDAESLGRAQVADKELRVAGERYRVLILPAMRALRHASLLKALEFHRAGGMVVALGALPEATERIGTGDPEVEALIREVFTGGRAAASNQEVLELIRGQGPRDFEVLNLAPDAKHPWVLHRTMGHREVYAVYGAAAASRCFFRSQGSLELWNPWNGETRALQPLALTSQGTVVSMPLGPTELQLLVFDAGKPAPQTLPGQLLEGPWDFELLPTRDNRWGDYSLPPQNQTLGAEVHHLRWISEVGEVEARTGFGPHFLRRGPLPDSPWQPYEYSTLLGLEHDAGHQGYHGLKGLSNPNFLVMGRQEFTMTDTVYHEEIPGAQYQFQTTVRVERTTTVQVCCGDIRPEWIEVDRRIYPGSVHSLILTAGTHTFLLTYQGPGKTWFRLETGGLPLACDAYAEGEGRVERFCFTAPPGLKSLTLKAFSVPRVIDAPSFVDVLETGPGPITYRISWKEPASGTTPVTLELNAVFGYPGAAVFAGPLLLDCGKGLISLGDWSRIDGLRSYSGGAWYRETFEAPPLPPGERLILDLGRVASSAEVFLNGQEVGVKVASPFTFDLTGHLKPGTNRLEVLVFNTLANHYSTIPTRYRGSLESGLIGPVLLTRTTL